MEHYIGIDVSKKWLDIDFCGEAKRYENETDGIEPLINELLILQKAGELKLVLCDATGGYEQKIVRACHVAQVPVHVAHANKVKYFAKSKGIQAKTDRLDATVLSDYGRLMNPLPDCLALTEDTEKMRELLKRREQLLEDKKRENNRLDKIINTDIIDSINEHIEWIKKEIKEIDKKLSMIGKEEEIKKQIDLLLSIPSIGKVAAYYLLAYLPELGKISFNALSALIGVAPYNKDSGNTQGKRFIQGGRSHLRRILYMSAMSAVRCNADLQKFYLRLRSTGKAAKVALVAVIRKLIGLANSIVRRQSAWQENCL